MSQEVIISVENLGKRYSLRHQRDQRYVALRDVIARRATAPLRALKSKLERRKEKTENGAGNLTSDLGPLTSGRASKEDFWALKNVSFEVRQGEVVGIIGRNGAGKSTLLKILSRITEPTEGRVRIKGRVASLLEVGTGFHPELTGRENIFLNGAILGMSRAEIRKKFDEIVAFAETEKSLDTPVKRILRSEIECEGCGLTECIVRKMECLTRISPQMAVEACAEFLESTESPSPERRSATTALV
jgi:lipopolysaccharide transport system ATP-binding protein